MMPKRVAVLVLIGVVAAGCSPESAAPPATLGPGAESSVAAVEQLHVYLVSGDFQEASALAIPKHAALASLAEGATFGQVADALENGDTDVAANFWSGFAQGVGESFVGEVLIEDAGTQSEDDETFHFVAVTPAGGVDQRFVTQDVAGHRVDLFASFGSAIAERMISPVEILITSATPDATLIIRELQLVVDSLTVAASDENTSPEAVQSILQLLELITRVG